MSEGTAIRRRHMCLHFVLQNISSTMVTADSQQQPPQQQQKEYDDGNGGTVSIGNICYTEEQLKDHNNGNGDIGNPWYPQQQLKDHNDGNGGIVNIGNTCYMGAAIQALANVSALSNFLIANEHQLISKQILYEYVQMLKHILVLKQPATPSPLKEVVDSMNSSFSDYGQHDSEEFIQFFVDALHEALKGVPRENKAVATDADVEKAAEKGVDGSDMWSSAIQQWTRDVLSSEDGSIVFELFAGQLLSELRCPNCGYSSKTVELFTTLPLQIPIPDSVMISYKFVIQHGQFGRSLHIPINSQICLVKDYISEDCGTDIGNLFFVILDKRTGVRNMEITRKFNADDREHIANNEEEGQNAVRIEDIDIWCFGDQDGTDGDNDHAIFFTWAEQHFEMGKQNSDGSSDNSQSVNWVNVDECFKDFTRPEAIDGSHCDRCSKTSSPSSLATPLFKQLTFMRLPDILVICFKRFVYTPSQDRLVKQMMPVLFPLDDFDLSRFVSADVPAEFTTHNSRYSCIAIVTHHGELDYGHYCSYVRHTTSDEWFFCNDSAVSPIKLPLDVRSAYIVFYQRVKASASSAVAPDA